MEGNAKIIKLIARDENVPFGKYTTDAETFTKDDKDYEKIAKELKDECIQMFMDAVEQEKKWADYLFKDGSIIGLNAELLKQYIEFIAGKRMRAVHLETPNNTGTTLSDPHGLQAVVSQVVSRN